MTSYHGNFLANNGSSQQAVQAPGARSHPPTGYQSCGMPQVQALPLPHQNTVNSGYLPPQVNPNPGIPYQPTGFPAGNMRPQYANSPHRGRSSSYPPTDGGNYLGAGQAHMSPTGYNSTGNMNSVQQQTGPHGAPNMNVGPYYLGSPHGYGRSPAGSGHSNQGWNTNEKSPQANYPDSNQNVTPSWNTNQRSLQANYPNHNQNVMPSWNTQQRSPQANYPNHNQNVTPSWNANQRSPQANYPDCNQNVTAGKGPHPTHGQTQPQNMSPGNKCGYNNESAGYPSKHMSPPSSKQCISSNRQTVDIGDDIANTDSDFYDAIFPKLIQDATDRTVPLSQSEGHGKNVSGTPPRSNIQRSKLVIMESVHQVQSRSRVT